MNQTEQTHLTFQASSHAGMRGKQNEDRYAVTPFQAGESEDIPSVLAVVCDGIGGHRAGEVAAEMGVSIITKGITEGDAAQPMATMQQAIIQASDAIYAASQVDLGRSGMGATCACAWVMDDHLYTANLGDSRIYMLRANQLIQLSTDHTWLQEAFEAGLISNKNVMDHPNAHVIRRYLGSPKPPEPDFRMWVFEEESAEDALANQGLTLEPGDLLMLCSDGLTDLVSDAEIQKVLQDSPLKESPEILIDMANQRGGHDNITVVVLEVPQKKKRASGKLRKRRLVTGCLVGIAVISLVITGLIIGFRWQRERMDQITTPSTEDTFTETEEVPSATVALTLTLDIGPSPTIEPTLEPGLETISPAASRTPWPTNTLEP